MNVRRTVQLLAALASALVVAVLAPMVGSASASEQATEQITVPTIVPTVAGALAAVNALPPVPDTAWGVDPATGRLVVRVSDAAPAAGVARLAALTSRFGGVLRIVHSARPLSEQLLIDPHDTNGVLIGGDEITDGSIVCSAGFNVVKAGVPYLLTAGHCTAGLPGWEDIGPSVVSAFPTTDYGLIRDDDQEAVGNVDLYNGTTQPITAVGTPFVGEQVCASGQTTGVTCGRITALDQTVDYGDGDVVHDLIETDVHTDHGDSGGPLFDGATGLGTVSGGDGTTDYFQPLAPVLRANDLLLALP